MPVLGGYKVYAETKNLSDEPFYGPHPANCRCGDCPYFEKDMNWPKKHVYREPDDSEKQL